MLRVYKENAIATLSHIKATKRSYCRSVCFQLYVLQPTNLKNASVKILLQEDLIDPANEDEIFISW